MSNPLSYLGLSDEQWNAAASAYRSLGLAAPMATSAPAPTSAAPTLSLRSRTSLSSSSAGPSTRTACEIYDAAKAAGQQAAILAALKPKCDAEKRLGTSYSPGGASLGGSSSSLAITGGTAPAIDGKVAESSGPSPIVLGAIALAVAGVGFVAYQRFAKGKKSKS